MKLRGKIALTGLVSVTVGSVAVYSAFAQDAQSQQSAPQVIVPQAAAQPQAGTPATPAPAPAATAAPAAAPAPDAAAAAPAAAPAAAAVEMPAEPTPPLWPAVVTDEIAKEHGGVESWGNIEAGARFFIERPPTSAPAWTTPSIQRPQAQSIAKYEEYGNVPEGLYLERFYVGGQTKDAEYYVDLRATDVGNNNQRFIFDWAETGVVSGSITWDQIPHLYSTTAQSIWNGVGTNYLTTNFNRWPGMNSNTPTNAQLAAAIAANVRTISIGIERDKFETDNRWTPTPDWDVKLDYSHETREGTQLAGVVWGGPGNGTSRVDVPRPVDDTTQQGRMSVERTGVWEYGKWNVRLTGSISSYENDYSSYTVQNPFAQLYGAANSSNYCASNYLATATATGGASGLNPPCARVSLAPSNIAYSANITSGVDLPFSSRFMNTVQYQSFQQNEAFIPDTVTTGTPYTTAGVALPQLTQTLAEKSLGGDVEILLVNSVIHTQITDDIKSTLKYRFYDNDNETPVKSWNWVSEDYTNSADTRSNFGYTYSKQEAADDVTWHFMRNGSIGGQAGWEEIQRDRRESLTTDEFTGQIHSDVRLDDIGMFRGSYSYGERRYDRYDPADWYETLYPTLSAGTLANYWGMRKFDLANRDREKAMVLFSFDNIPYIPNLTLTPSAGMRFDHYLSDTSEPIYTPSGQTAYEVGLQKDNQWNAGLEASYSFKPGTSVVLAYVHENYDKNLIGTSAASNTVEGNIVVPGTFGTINGVVIPSRFYSNMNEDVDTFMAGGNVALNDSWDFSASYSISFGNEAWTTQSYGPVSDCTLAVASNCQQFPNVVTNAQRIDTVLKYHLPSEWVTKMGFSGDVYWKVKYSWDHLAMTNWQNDLVTPYMYLVDATNAGRNIAMAAYNPNYDVHVVATTINFKW